MPARVRLELEMMSESAMRRRGVSLQDLSTSRQVTRLGIVLARSTPQSVGYRLTDLAAGLIVGRRPAMYRTVVSNLHQVLGDNPSGERLHAMAHSVFRHALRTYYDFFRAVGAPHNAFARAVRMQDEGVASMKGALASDRGVLLLGTHMSNFDLGIMAIMARGFRVQLLSLANPRPGFHLLNELRARAGAEVTPISADSLRAAIRRLKDAGMVITGLDRPIPRDDDLVECFGRPSYLPLGPARLATLADAEVFIGSCFHDAAEGYRVDITGPVEVMRTGDRRCDVRANARRLSALLEHEVRSQPDQWMMFHPFWPAQNAGA